MSNKFERAMNEIDILESDLEEATTEKRRQEILNAIREIEEELRGGDEEDEQ